MSATGIMLSGAALAAAGIVARGVFSPGSSMFGPVISRSTYAAGIALTFDDGPDSVATPQILDILAEHHVKAAFFLVGRNVDLAQDVVRRIHAEGHLVGNHSFDHANGGAFRFTRYWLDQLRRTDDAIESAINIRPAHFRPPMGIKAPPMLRAARQTGHDVVTWSRRALDGVNCTSLQIEARLKDRVSRGDIVLMHDGASPRFRTNANATIAALPVLIEHWKARGLPIVRLDQLIAASNA